MESNILVYEIMTKIKMNTNYKNKIKKKGLQLSLIKKL